MADEKQPAKKATKAQPRREAVATSTNTNAELAVRAARPYKDETVEEVAHKTGRDHTAPGNEAEHPVYSEETVDLRGRTEVAAETLAKPAQAGFPEVEIATRTSDRTQAEDTRFRKRYVVLREAYQPDTDAIHARNKIEILNDAINHGLHPQGEAEFDGDEPHADGVSLYLDYSVEVRPASTDDRTPEAATPLHVLRDKYDGTTESEAAQKAEGFDPEK